MRGALGALVNPGRWVDAGRSGAGRVRWFFTDHIWEVRVAELGPAKNLAFRASRVGYSTIRDVFANRLTLRAAALTYFSVLSVVPFLAFAFAVLKGFGAYRTFVEGTVRPYVQDTFAANPALLTAVEKILQFVERTDASRLGTVGVLFLVYTSVSLLSNIEVTLNDLWGAKAQRPFLRQLTDYVTLLVIAPLLVVVAATFSTAAQSSDAMRFLRDTLALGPLIDFLLRFSSVAIVAVALFATYIILPNVRTRTWSAFVGAVVAAALWQGALVLHVQFQMGVARYNALYSVLGAIPIFLVWTYVSWVIVLVGAQLAANHQNEQLARQRLHARRADQALKEMLAIAVAARIARDFLTGGPRRSHEDLAAMLEMPPPTVEEILDALVRAGLLARTLSSRDIGYLPARDLDAIRVSDLRDALRRDPQSREIRSALEQKLGPELQQVVDALEKEARAPAWNRTLRELAAMARDPVSPAADGHRPASATGDDDTAVLDAKQPEVPR